ncbi:aspartate/glutamate racemase family protein [Aurantiacibacter poecillastricola]|uniref:aspartate/glutamate racemase family protein n=1 Tax=Aurantiacibacter poecillastricola TaxID=3064385 RepID=UPI00273DCEB0|nr:amino acid racemase [Aurantiacibacter sp. 219JJ12-13]MDP5262577.1 amino acid racemase [Aurantiacibacter sp. 219JJ12-13]
MNLHTLGLIGGMSWVSTQTYFERINRFVQRHVGKTASAPMLIENLDFRRLYRAQTKEDWENATNIIADSAQRLSEAGAEMIVIGANSMHKVYRDVEARVETPILHIAECVGKQMAKDGVERAALIGTRNVMTESFYRRRLVSHGVDLLPPEMDNVETLDRIIYEELMIGKASKDARRALRSMFTNLQKEGAQAVILACTELEMVVDVDANILPIYDCTAIHADAAAQWIIGDEQA